MVSSSRIGLALTVSVLLHLALLAGRLPAPATSPPMRLDVRLMVPEVEEKIEEKSIPEPALFEKDTIAQETTKAPEVRPKTQTSSGGKPTRLKTSEEQQALRKLSEHILYPPAAVDAGHEGTVHLLLKLDATGLILHASIAASSNHPELDHAALQAALRAGRINGGGRNEIILPITFRLQ
jgi:TonB family protein